MARRSSGEGSVSFHKASGLWQATLSKTVGGERTRRVFYGKTKNEALDKWKEAKGELEAGVKPTDETTGQFLTGRYLPYILENRRLSTHAAYSRILVKNVVPLIGDVPLKELNALHVEGMLSALKKAGKSTRVQHQAHVILGSAFKRAMTWKLLVRNPVEGVERPVWKKKKFVAWNEVEANDFLKTAKDHWLYPLYFAALDTGARQAELLALEWPDVDLHNRTVYFHQQLVEVDGVVEGPGELKTEASRRKIKISSALVTILRHQRARLLAGGLASCKLVFPNTEGGYYQKTNLIHSFKKMCKKAGVRAIRFHDLRHTCATILQANGMKPKDLQARLGHADFLTTYNTYVKPTAAGNEEGADIMERVIGKAVDLR